MSCLYLENSRASIENREFSVIYFVVSSLLSVKFIMTCVSHYVRKCKTAMDSGFHAVESKFHILNIGYLVIEAWIPDFNRQRDSKFLELNSGFPSPGVSIPQEQILGWFWIPQTKFPGLRNSDYFTWSDVYLKFLVFIWRIFMQVLKFGLSSQVCRQNTSLLVTTLKTAV